MLEPRILQLTTERTKYDLAISPNELTQARAMGGAVGGCFKPAKKLKSNKALGGVLQSQRAPLALSGVYKMQGTFNIKSYGNTHGATTPNSVHETENSCWRELETIESRNLVRLMNINSSPYGSAKKDELLVLSNLRTDPDSTVTADKKDGTL